MRAFSLLICILCIGAVACGQGTEASGAEASGESSGAEVIEEVAADEEAEPDSEPAPAPSGPSSITVKATVNHVSAAASVRLLDSSGGVAAEGVAGESLSVPAGDYSLVVKLTDPKDLVDLPSRRQDITLLPGGKIEQEVAFPWARIQLNVRVNGRSAKGATIRIFRQGAEILKMKSGAPHVPISPGRYEGEVKTRGAKIKVKGLMFPEGGTHGVPVDVQI